MKETVKEKLINFIFLLIACAVGAFATTAVMIPNGLTSGGRHQFFAGVLCGRISDSDCSAGDLGSSGGKEGSCSNYFVSCCDVCHGAF